MSLLKTIVHHPSDAPDVSYANPAILIEGNPLLEKWPQLTTEDDKIKIGVMTCEPSVNRSVKAGFLEYCYLIEGVVEITEDGGEPVTYQAGDSFVLQNGFKGVWRTIEKYKKVYLCVYE